MPLRTGKCDSSAVEWASAPSATKYGKAAHNARHIIDNKETLKQGNKGFAWRHQTPATAGTWKETFFERSLPNRLSLISIIRPKPLPLSSSSPTWITNAESENRLLLTCLGGVRNWTSAPTLHWFDRLSLAEDVAWALRTISSSSSNLLEEKPAHHPLELLDVALKHTGWMPPAYLYSLTESAKVEGRRIVNSDIN